MDDQEQLLPAESLLLLATIGKSDFVIKISEERDAVCFMSNPVPPPGSLRDVGADICRLDVPMPLAAHALGAELRALERMSREERLTAWAELVHSLAVRRLPRAGARRSSGAPRYVLCLRGTSGAMVCDSDALGRGETPPAGGAVSLRRFVRPATSPAPSAPGVAPPADHASVRDGTKQTGDQATTAVPESRPAPDGRLEEAERQLADLQVRVRELRDGTAEGPHAQGAPLGDDERKALRERAREVRAALAEARMALAEEPNTPGGARGVGRAGAAATPAATTESQCRSLREYSSHPLLRGPRVAGPRAEDLQPVRAQTRGRGTPGPAEVGHRRGGPVPETWEPSTSGRGTGRCGADAQRPSASAGQQRDTAGPSATATAVLGPLKDRSSMQHPEAGRRTAPLSRAGRAGGGAHRRAIRGGQRGIAHGGALRGLQLDTLDVAALVYLGAGDAAGDAEERGRGRGDSGPSDAASHPRAVAQSAGTDASETRRASRTRALMEELRRQKQARAHGHSEGGGHTMEVQRSTTDEGHGSLAASPVTRSHPQDNAHAPPRSRGRPVHSPVSPVALREAILGSPEGELGKGFVTSPHRLEAVGARMVQ